MDMLNLKRFRVKGNIPKVDDDEINKYVPTL